MEIVFDRKEKIGFLAKCHIDCGEHGKCLVNDRNRCECEEGWSGTTCTKKTCSKFCQQCNDDGSCRCENGFLGRYCQIRKLQFQMNLLMRN